MTYCSVHQISSLQALVNHPTLPPSKTRASLRGTHRRHHPFPWRPRPFIERARLQRRQYSRRRPSSVTLKARSHHQRKDTRSKHLPHMRASKLPSDLGHRMGEVLRLAPSGMETLGLSSGAVCSAPMMARNGNMREARSSHRLRGAS